MSAPLVNLLRENRTFDQLKAAGNCAEKAALLGRIKTAKSRSKKDGAPKTEEEIYSERHDSWLATAEAAVAPAAPPASVVAAAEEPDIIDLAQRLADATVSVAVAPVARRHDFLSSGLNNHAPRNNATITLPALAHVQWDHPTYGPMQAVIDILYVDEMDSCTQPPECREYVRRPVDSDGLVQSKRPPIRVCVFHAFLEFTPKNTPLQALVHRMFSSPLTSADILELDQPGWDAYTLLDRPGWTLRMMLESTKQWSNSRFLKKPFPFPDNTTTLKTILPRDLLALLCRDECNEFECFQRSHVVEDVNEDKIARLKEIFAEQDRKMGYKNTANQTEQERRLRAMLEAPVLRKPCLHNKLHDSIHQEDALVVYTEDDSHSVRPGTSIVSDGADEADERKSKRRSKRRKDEDINAEFKVDFRLNTSWGQRLTFEQLGWEEVTRRVRHPWFYVAFLERLNEHLDMRRRHAPHHCYTFVPHVRPEQVTTADDLEQLFQHYHVRRVDTDVLGVSRTSTDECLCLLVRFTLRDDDAQPILRRDNSAYTRHLFVPVPIDVLNGHARYGEMLVKKTVEQMLEWRDPSGKVWARIRELRQQVEELGKKDIKDKKSGQVWKGSLTPQWRQKKLTIEAYLSHVLPSEETLNDFLESQHEIDLKSKQEAQLLQSIKTEVYHHEHKDELEVKAAEDQRAQDARLAKFKAEHERSLRVTQLLAAYDQPQSITL